MSQQIDTTELGSGLMRAQDGTVRCTWPADKTDYLQYHDEEWGMPQDDDIKLFEKICLEGFQSGLSWLTILRKRENFRAGFAGFDFHKVAKFDDADVERLVNDAGIIRHRGKIKSTINNAKKAIELQESAGSLGSWFWRFEPGPKDRPDKFDGEALLPLGKTAISERMSKELKKMGWSFVGPTTCYAFMQAMGMVNDHIEGCFCREKIEQERAKFKRP